MNLMRLWQSLALTLGLLCVVPIFAAGGDGKIGLGLAENDGKIQVVLVQPGSPAAKAGIKTGMVLDEINGTKTAGKSVHDCARLIRGDRGTTVILKLDEPDAGQPFSAALTRE